MQTQLRQGPVAPQDIEQTAKAFSHANSVNLSKN